MRAIDLFAIGQVAVGDQFVGRRQQIDELSAIFTSGVNKHLIGATRIGKTSLVSRVFAEHENDERILSARVDMSSSADACAFWYELGMAIADAAEDADLNMSSAARLKKEFDEIDPSQRSWHMRMQRPLKKMLKEMQSIGYRVVVAIDEFDAVYTVFGEDHSQYQLLRSILSDGEFAINGVIVSRRNLDVLEAKARVIAASNFSNIFDTQRLVKFGKRDMNLFYEKLGQCGIRLDDDAVGRFEYYTGGIPYLCCKLANELCERTEATEVEFTTADMVDAARLECQFDINDYYDDLIRKLEEDGHLEPLIYLAFDEMKTLAYEHNRNNMIQMGYLNEVQVGDSFEYYAYCKDFMNYLRHRKLNMPIRDLLDASEHKLKEVFADAYPQFTQVTYNDILISRNYEKKRLVTEIPGLNFDWDKGNTTTFLRNSAQYIENPTVLDVITINYVLLQMHKYHWGDVFSRYFNNDRKWREKLKEVDGIRNPFSHAHGEYVPQDKVERCIHILEELIKYDFNLSS